MSLQKQPPRWMDRLLRWFCKPSLLEHIEGDLHEEFQHNLDKKGATKARLSYLLAVLDHYRPFAVRPERTRSVALLRNYLLVSVRFIRRNLGYSAINIFGLSIGLTISILSYLFVQHELSFDQFHDDADRIYRVAVATNFREPQVWEGTPFPLADAMTSTISNVEKAVRISEINHIQLIRNDRLWDVGVTLVSEDFFDLLNFPLVNSSQPTGLRSGEIYITEEVSDRFFGDLDPVGAEVELVRDTMRVPFLIAGVLENPPAHSSLQFKTLISDEHYSDFFGEASTLDWANFKSPTATLIKVRNVGEVTHMMTQLNELADQNGTSERFRTTELKEKFPLQSFTELHFSNNADLKRFPETANRSYVYMVIAIGLITLVLACLNFVNMAVGLSAKRHKEVAIRKVMGAGRGKIINQFFSESGLLVCLGLGVAMLLTVLVLPFFNHLIGENIRLEMLEGRFLYGLAGLLAFSVVIIGSYPSFILASYRVINLIRSRVTTPTHNNLTVGLMVFQFVITISIILVGMGWQQQLKLIGNYDLGYSPDQVLYQEFEIREALTDAEVKLLREKAVTHSAINGVSSSRGSIVGDHPGSYWSVEFQGEVMAVAALKVDYDFLDVLGVSLKEGRNFDHQNEADLESAVIVNETFINHFELTDYLGTVPEQLFGPRGPKIIGVVRDYHFQSLRKEIEPLVLNLRPDSKNTELFVLAESGREVDAAGYFEEVWKEVLPGRSIGLQFLDDNVALQYEKEKKWEAALNYAGAVTLLIALTGMIGLFSLILSNHKRDLCVHKVLGADKFSVWRRYSRRLLATLAIATTLAVPLSMWVTNLWTQNYAVRETLTVGVLLIPVLVVFALILAVLFIQVILAFRINPASVLAGE